MKLNNVLFIGSLALATYFACTPQVIPVVNSILSERSGRILPDQSELDRIFEEERKNVGLEESTNIDIAFVPNLAFIAGAPARSYAKPGGYTIEIDPRYGATRHNVRHELCHLKRDPFPIWFLSYIYFYEPRAILCSVFSEGRP